MHKISVNAKDISKRFNKKVLFSHLNFEINKGETMAIIGYSGCGKTTLLRMIGGFEETSSGMLLVEEEKVVSPSKESILVSQEHNQLLPWKTAIENVAWPIIATDRSCSKEEAHRLAKKYLVDLRINPSDFNKYPIQLSGGMKQRVTIARALALKPKLLLLDEPFGSLDDLTRRKAQEVVKTACKSHDVTAVLVTHNISEAIAMANNILVFSESGKVEMIKNGKDVERKLKKLLNI